MNTTLDIAKNSLTNLKTYKEYLNLIGALPTYQLEKAITCGLPAVWLYMKAIGLEEAFFDILSKLKTKPFYFKELFYLLIFTNGTNKYFPHIALDFLHIDLPKDIQAAQINIGVPTFDLAYCFTKQQLTEALSFIAKPNIMIRLGDEHNAVGMMLNNNGMFSFYHSNNTTPLQFKSLDNCVEAIIRTLSNKNNYISCCVQAYSILPSNNPSSINILEKLLKQKPSSEQINNALAVAVRGDYVEIAKKLLEYEADPLSLEHNLLYLAWKHKSDMFELLITHGATLSNEDKQLYTQDHAFITELDNLLQMRDFRNIASKSTINRTNI